MRLRTSAQLLLLLSYLPACFAGESDGSEHGTEPADAGVGGGDGGGDGRAPQEPSPTNGREACNAYIECTSQTFPAGLGPIAEAYGQNGSCWASLDEQTCVEACVAGLRQLRASGSTSPACPVCFTDSDCAGSADGTVCDTAQGECVRCTNDANCSGIMPACDLATHTCVACTIDSHCSPRVCDRWTHECADCVVDSDCPAAAPHCLRDGAGARCVECRSNSDCPGTGGACQDFQCCSARSCEELQAEYPDSALCGSIWDVLSACPAHVDCGPCARGTCEELLFGILPSRCSLAGEPCEPSTPGTCMGDEVCTYQPGAEGGRGGYACASDVRGAECEYGAAPYSCGANAFGCGSATSESGVCKSYCLVNEDCASGELCRPYAGELRYGICA